MFKEGSPKRKERRDRNRLNRPLKIGVTGGIGSGKSTVCRIFSVLGIPTYDADAAAKRLMHEDEALRSEIISAFGKDSYNLQGHLNTSYLSQIVFRDESKREVLNNLVHPHTIRDFEAWAEKQSGFPYIVKEAALLYEAGADKSVDRVIVVYAPEALRMKRVLERDPSRTASGVRAIMAKQMSEKEKMKRADFVVRNDESTLVSPQVVKIHNHLIEATDC